MDAITIIPVKAVPEVLPGSKIGPLLWDALRHSGQTLIDGDIVVITQKIVSKAEGRLVEVDPEDPASKRIVVESESKRVVRRRGALIISETKHGFVCANAGVDSSNVEDAQVCLLPLDPDLSARRIRAEIKKLSGANVGVIVSDTFGRPWREGQTDVAIGVAGILPFIDYRGTEDQNGKPLHATMIAVADEIAGAAELVMGKKDRIPAAVVRGARVHKGRGNARMLIRSADQDLFR